MFVVVIVFREMRKKNKRIERRGGESLYSQSSYRTRGAVRIWMDGEFLLKVATTWVTTSGRLQSKYSLRPHSHRKVKVGVENKVLASQHVTFVPSLCGRGTYDVIGATQFTDQEAIAVSCRS